jgi:Stress responsive A/B Barrel Domain
MIRHVVLFTWSEDADEDRRTTTLDALRGLERTVGGMSALTVAPDAGLTEGNAHAVLMADFPDVEAFRRYAADPVHQEVLAEHVRPFLTQRSAVQYQI